MKLDGMTLEIAGHSFAYEMECVVRLFFAGAKIKVIHVGDEDELNPAEIGVKANNLTDEIIITTRVEPLNKDKLLLTASVLSLEFSKTATEEIDCKVHNLDINSGSVIPPASTPDSGFCEQRLGALLFNLLCEMTDKRPEWGILTGIRPVRMARRWSEDGLSEDAVLRRFTDDYLVLPRKAELCAEIARAQDKILGLNAPDTFSLYISIPFCPTRCVYCSFVSCETSRDAKLVPAYVELLCRELAAIGKIAKTRNLRLLTIYVGGGTPTALTAGELEQIFAAVRDNFNTRDLREYTVEAGRADTVTSEKLEIISRFGAGRISINPQSMTDGVLRAIGRAHTPAQVEDAYKLARSLGFKEINMDLIAGLPCETLESFQSSLDRVISLGPENITVHTLTVKRSSGLREDSGAFQNLNPHTARMLEYAANQLAKAGYAPYYLYRQKAAAENLENIGYSKQGHEGIYNIFSMEDTHNILAAGAGGVSKLMAGKKDVNRVFNYKYPYEYINRFTEILNRKETINEGNY